MKLKSYKFIQFLCCFVAVELYGSYATFKPYGVRHTLKISIISKNFLKNIIQMQQSFVQQRMNQGKEKQSCVQLVDAMNQQYQKIVQVNYIDRASYEALMHCNERLKRELTEQQGNISFSQPERPWFDWFLIVSQTVDQLKIYSHDQDLQWLKDQIKQLGIIIHSGHWDNLALEKIVMRIFEICNEFMHAYDGFFINDYDLLVLSNVILVVMAIRC